MTNSIIIIGFIASITLIGDYFLKIAATGQEGVLSGRVFGGAIAYAIVAIGWYFLMKSNSLATIGVMFSASTILLLAGLGYFVFKEPFGLREAVGILLAIAAVVVMRPD